LVIKGSRVHNLHPLIPRKELITVKTIRAMGGKEKIRTDISKPSRLKQILAQPLEGT